MPTRNKPGKTPLPKLAECIAYIESCQGWRFSHYAPLTRQYVFKNPANAGIEEAAFSLTEIRDAKRNGW